MATAPMPSGAYLVNLAEEHAFAQGFRFDESGKKEFRQIADQGLQNARQADIFTVEDILRDVAPNTIRLADSIITFREGVLLTVRAVRQGLSSICPLFPFS